MGRKSTTYNSKKNQKKFRKGKKSTNKNQVKKKSTKKNQQKKINKKKQKGGTNGADMNLDEIYEQVSNINHNYWCKDIFNMGEYVQQVINSETNLVSFNNEIKLCILEKTELEELGERIRRINNFIEQLGDKKNNTSSGSILEQEKKKKLLEYCEKLKSEMEIYESIVKKTGQRSKLGKIENFNFWFSKWYTQYYNDTLFGISLFNKQMEAQELAKKLIEKLIELHNAMIETEKVKKEYEKANNLLNIRFTNAERGVILEI